MELLRNTIFHTMTQAMKEARKEELETLRFLMAQIKNREIELHKREEGLSDEETLEVIMREAKKRRESIAEFQKGDRQDLVQKESGQLKILEHYLPEQLSDEKIREEVAKAVKESGASSMKDLGKVMSVLMPNLKGRADGALVSKLVKELLS